MARIHPAERAYLAAMTLDLVRPDWPNLVQVDRLDFSSHCDCVLGQIYGLFDIGEYELAKAGFYRDHACWGGFFAQRGFIFGLHDHGSLKAAWAVEIEERLAA